MNSISEPDRQEPPSTSTQPVNDTLDFTELDVTDENVSATLRCKWKSSIRRASDLPDAGTDLLRVQRAKRLRRSRSPKQTITPTPTEIPSRLQQTPGGLGTSSSPSEFEDFWSSREGLQADCTWPYVGGTGAHDSTLGSLGLDF